MQGISVVIPVYNRESFLEEAIHSVLMQKYSGSIEIIVSDDGSSDRSVEIAKSFGEPVRVLIKPKNCLSQGVSGARNRGIAVARFPYIAFLDSDDVFLPDHLNRMAEKLDNNQDLGFVFCRILQMKDDGEEKLYAPWTKIKLSKKDIKYPAISGSVIHTNVILIRKYVISNVGGFNENYSNGEDGDLWMRISEKYKGDFLNHYGAVYRVSHKGEQLTNNHNHNCFEKIYKSAYDRCNNENKIDSYRHFRLSLILADYSKCRFLSMMNIFVRHPFWVVYTFINIKRIINRYHKISWKSVPDFKI